MRLVSTYLKNTVLWMKSYRRIPRNISLAIWSEEALFVLRAGKGSVHDDFKGR